jgi:hypothetical protein
MANIVILNDPLGSLPSAPKDDDDECITDSCVEGIGK